MLTFSPAVQIIYDQSLLIKLILLKKSDLFLNTFPSKEISDSYNQITITIWELQFKNIIVAWTILQKTNLVPCILSIQKKYFTKNGLALLIIYFFPAFTFLTISQLRKM